MLQSARDRHAVYCSKNVYHVFILTLTDSRFTCYFDQQFSLKTRCRCCASIVTTSTSELCCWNQTYFHFHLLKYNIRLRCCLAKCFFYSFSSFSANNTVGLELISSAVLSLTNTLASGRWIWFLWQLRCLCKSSLQSSSQQGGLTVNLKTNARALAMVFAKAWVVLCTGYSGVEQTVAITEMWLRLCVCVEYILFMLLSSFN